MQQRTSTTCPCSATSPVLAATSLCSAISTSVENQLNGIYTVDVVGQVRGVLYTVPDSTDCFIVLREYQYALATFIDCWIPL